MKQIFAFILICVLCPVIIYSAADGNKTFKYSPEKPKPGETITIKFNASNTSLENKEVSYIMYSVKNGVINAEDYTMKKAGAEWEGTYQIPDSSQAIGIKFIDVSSPFGEQVAQTTYPIQLFGKNGKLLKGTKAAAAYITGYQGVVNAKANTAEAYKLYKEEFKADPDLARYYIYVYCSTVNSVEKQNANGIIAKTLAQLGKKKEALDESQLMSVTNVYQQMLKDKEKGKEYSEYIIKKYPEGKTADFQFLDKYYKIKNDPKTQEELFIAYSAKHPEADGQSFSAMLGQVLTGYCMSGKYEEAKAFLSKIKFSSTENKWAWAYVNLAQAASICMNKGAGEQYAEYFNDLALKTTRAFLNLPKPNPNWLTAGQFLYMKKEFSTQAYPLIAMVYEKYKTSKEALAIAEEGYKLSSFNKDMRQIYTRLLVANGRAEEAIKMLDEMIVDGNKAEDVMKVHKSAYEKVKGTLEGYDAYLAGLKDKSVAIIKEKIKNSIISKPAPQFTLKDTEGKTVSLADYKGKTVILDFWATWCSPCKASFPHMKKAQERYASNPNVKFLFVNTMERVENPSENAVAFIKTNNYPFHVAVDAESKVSTSYDVSGIPTKIFIDKEGKIRYIAVGFEETTIQEEIDTVIDIIK
jgi:peroxiredoxin